MTAKDGSLCRSLKCGLNYHHPFTVYTTTTTFTASLLFFLLEAMSQFRNKMVAPSETMDAAQRRESGS